MKRNDWMYDTLSVGVVAIISIICVTLLVLGLAPGIASSEAPASRTGNIAGSAYADAAVPVGTQFDVSLLDFNGDGMLDFYDYQDVLDGTVDCQAEECDLNKDGLIDATDSESFNLLVRRLYDYDGDGKLTRDDPIFLRDVIYGYKHCNANHICDLDGDGFVSSQDVTLYTSLIFNYDNPQVRQ